MIWEFIPFSLGPGYVVETSLEMRPKTILTFSRVWWYWLACNPRTTEAGMKTSAVSFVNNQGCISKPFSKNNNKNQGGQSRGGRGLETPNEYLEVFFLSPILKFFKILFIVCVYVGEFQILVPQLRCGGQ